MAADGLAQLLADLQRECVEKRVRLDRARTREDALNACLELTDDDATFDKMDMPLIPPLVHRQHVLQRRLGCQAPSRAPGHAAQPGPAAP